MDGERLSEGVIEGGAGGEGREGGDKKEQQRGKKGVKVLTADRPGGRQHFDEFLLEALERRMASIKETRVT